MSILLTYVQLYDKLNAKSTIIILQNLKEIQNLNKKKKM